MIRWWGIVFLACPLLPAGQAYPLPDTITGPLPKLLIKTDALRWISPLKPAANLGLEVTVAPHHRMDLSLGWYLGSNYFASFNGESYQGPRLRAGWKWIGWIDPGTLLYAGLEGRYDRITHREWAYVSRQGQQYIEIFLRNRQIESLGAAVRIGMQLYLGKSGRWVFEPEFLLGVARHTVTWRDPPDVTLAGNQDGWFDFRYPEGTSTWFYPVISLNVGYVLVP